MQINERLLQIRKARNKTQEEISQQIGILKQHYYRYEKGIAPMPTEHIVKLCKYYNVSADYLLCLIDEERPLY